MSESQTNVTGSSSLAIAAEKAEKTQEQAAPAEAAPAPPPQEDDFAKRFAILSKKQKQMFEREQSLKPQLQELAEWKKRQELKKQDPIKYLEQEGLTLDEILQRAAKYGEPVSVEDEVKSLKEKIAEKEKLEKEAQEKAQKESQEREEQLAIDNYKKQIQTHIEQDPAKYETILALKPSKLLDPITEIYNVCALHFQNTGEFLDIGKAADLVEDFLLENAKPLAALKKLAPKTEPIEQVPAPELKQSSVPPTLTNKISSEPRATGAKKLSREESIREAAKHLRWNT